MYNYKKASEIFKRFFDLCVDPWTLTDTEKQQNRREFMWCLTRKADMSNYLEYIEEVKENVCVPCEGMKSRMWDFDSMREYDSLIEEIKNFAN